MEMQTATPDAIDQLFFKGLCSGARSDRGLEGWSLSKFAGFNPK